MDRDRTAPPLRTSRNPLAHVFAKYSAEATVTETALLTPTMRRIRLESEAIAGLDYTPGQHVRIQINDPLSLYGILKPVETLRTYTIWRHEPGEQAFEILCHLYDGEGIGLTWAREVSEGDTVVYWGPQGDFAVRQASYHLFVGEETAAAAFAPMIAALDPGQEVYAVLESDSAEDEVPLALGDGRTAVRVHRHGAPAASSQALLDAVAALELPDHAGAAYLAGEAHTARAVRDHLIRDRGWDRTAITVKPFWTPGKRGLH
jgi:NADPH-dependent ferric siderophore reductase